MEWIYLFFFLVLPTTALIISLLSGSDDFWAYTGLIWFCSILVFFTIFCANVIFYEIKACFVVMRNMDNFDDDSYFSVIKRSILLRQNATYGGYKTVTVVSMGKISSAEHTDTVDKNLEVPDTRHEDLSWRARLTLNPFFQSMDMYEHLESPKMIYTSEDARDIRPFMTRYAMNISVSSFLTVDSSCPIPLDTAGTRGPWKRFSVDPASLDMWRFSADPGL